MGIVINTNLSTTVAPGTLSYASAPSPRNLSMSAASLVESPTDERAESGASITFSAAATFSAAPSYNVATATSYLQEQDRAFSTAEQSLRRAHALWTLSRDSSKTPDELAEYDKEYQELRQRLAALTEIQFNGTALFGDAASGVMQQVIVGGDAKPAALSAKDLADPWIGIGMLVEPNSADTLDRVSRDDIAAAMANVATMRESNASEQSFLGFTLEMVARKKANSAAAAGTEDVDAVEESTLLARSEILKQTGAAIVAQANENGETVLRLLETAVQDPAPAGPETQTPASSSGVLVADAKQPQGPAELPPELNSER